MELIEKNRFCLQKKKPKKIQSVNIYVFTDVDFNLHSTFKKKKKKTLSSIFFNSWFQDSYELDNHPIFSYLKDELDLDVCYTLFKIKVLPQEYFGYLVNGQKTYLPRISGNTIIAKSCVYKNNVIFFWKNKIECRDTNTIINQLSNGLSITLFNNIITYISNDEYQCIFLGIYYKKYNKVNVWWDDHFDSFDGE